jgi:hypothetical protein
MQTAVYDKTRFSASLFEPKHRLLTNRRAKVMEAYRLRIYYFCIHICDHVIIAYATLGFCYSSGGMVHKVALTQVFSGYYGFPCQILFHRLLHIHHLSSGADTIWQLVTDVPSGLSHTTPRNLKRTAQH